MAGTGGNQMTEIPKCTCWLGHKFEARYSTKNPALLKLLDNAVGALELHPFAMKAMREEEYEGDICVRCGYKVMK
jgi:hypothetical protein